MRCLLFSTLHPWLFSASDDCSICVWNWQSRSQQKHHRYIIELPDLTTFFLPRSLLSTIHRHTHWVTSLSLHPSLPFLLSSSLDGSARLWDYSRYTEKFLTTRSVVTCFFFSLAHRTSSTTSPLTAVDTLFGALDVATEQVADGNELGRQ